MTLAVTKPQRFTPARVNLLSMAVLSTLAAGFAMFTEYYFVTVSCLAGVTIAIGLFNYRAGQAEKNKSQPG